MTDLKRFSLGTVASCVLLATAPALAQSSTPPAQAPAATPSDSQLRAYAKAVIDLTAIQQEMTPRIEAAPEAERPALQQQAGERMTTAVQRHDLDPDTFNRITAAAQQDPQIAEQLRTYVQAEAAGR